MGLEVGRAEDFVVVGVGTHLGLRVAASRVYVLLSGSLRVAFLLLLFHEHPVDARVGRVKYLLLPSARDSAGKKHGVRLKHWVEGSGRGTGTWTCLRYDRLARSDIRWRFGKLDVGISIA